MSSVLLLYSVPIYITTIKRIDNSHTHKLSQELKPAKIRNEIRDQQRHNFNKLLLMTTNKNCKYYPHGGPKQHTFNSLY